MTSADPYEEVTYRYLPIEWTAPERLALTSLLHAGPRSPLEGYRVLELGCGNGANLLPQAFYRRHSMFIGLDKAHSQIEEAESACRALGLTNIEFIHADLIDADALLTGQFDYIIAHGIFSWVPLETRDALLRLCATRLRAGGLVYLNYNSKPGWTVRGMVRDFLLAQTAGIERLQARAEAAIRVADAMADILHEGNHPYTTLIVNEFRFVCENDPSHIAHEYLAPFNQAYWRSEFLVLTRLNGLSVVGDADFNYASGRIPPELGERLRWHHVVGRSIEDTIDLLYYRQLHSPILALSGFGSQPPTLEEFGALFVASCLLRCDDSDNAGAFRHESGYTIDVSDPVLSASLERLAVRWPKGMRVRELLPDLQRPVIDDLTLLHRNGLIELRCTDPDVGDLDPAPLNTLERGRGGYATTCYHTRTA